MTQTIRWGILGPGAIARKFAASLRDTDGAVVAAVGSRSLERAAEFAAEYDIPRSHASYEALAADADLDAVYVATPHAFHKAHTILCLRHDKHVLCEKPLAINAGEAAEMIQAARERKRVLMEAMLTRFLPSMAKVRELVAGGAVGEVRMITAGFGFRADIESRSRLFDPALGGGALLDVGVYPLSFAHMILGAPDRIHAMARLGGTGVDEESAALLGYGGGRLAMLTAAIRLNIPREAFVLGTAGRIRIPSPWWRSSEIIVKRTGGEEMIMKLPINGTVYTPETEAFMNLIRTGELESDVLPLDESLSIMQTMDAIRAQWGMKYPME
ncbi:MAG: Gfo/Idh/MocA family oxidoreductase [bacterium]